jgi:hypothetical protein
MTTRDRTAALFVLVPLLAGVAGAYETDQYTERLADIEDSVEILNRQVNAALERVATDWKYGVDRKRFATRVYREIGGRHWVDKLERYAVRSPEIDRIEVAKAATIYGDLPFWSTPIVSMVGVGKTIKLGGTLIGTDKIGHFLSQGWKYYKRHARGVPEAEVVRLGLRNERGIFGAATTGVFSNADLVANYEGYLFYRSLFEDDVVPGKPAVVHFPNDRAVIQRPFDWRDHVNDYWDEALNPNRYAGHLHQHMVRNLEELCHDFRSEPDAFRSSHEQDLERRYAHLGLRETRSLRLDRVCSEERVTDVSPTTLLP